MWFVYNKSAYELETLTVVEARYTSIRETEFSTIWYELRSGRVNVDILVSY